MEILIDGIFDEQALMVYGLCLSNGISVIALTPRRTLRQVRQMTSVSDEEFISIYRDLPTPCRTKSTIKYGQK